MGRGVVLAGTALAVLLVALVAPAGAAAAGEQPNILVFVTDDQRAGLPVMPFVRSWFRLGGVRYPNAFANAPLCCPARASIMTGRYPHNHGVVNNQSATSLDQHTTLQKALHDAGYRTAPRRQVPEPVGPADAAAELRPLVSP